MLNTTDMINLDVQAFILDCKIRNLSQNTLLYYRQELSILTAYCNRNRVVNVTDLTPQALRLCIDDLSTHRNPGGVHAFWRACKAFLRWYGVEEEPEGWRNPIAKVKPPKLSTDPLPGVSVDTFKRLVSFCDSKSYYDIRNKSIFYFMIDTGIRVSELCELQLSNINIITGGVNIEHGKGDKRRVVWMGVACRRELTRYLRKRKSLNKFDPLFCHIDGKPFNRKGIEEVINSVSKRAGIEPPSPHDFRRAFALNMLRAGTSIFVLQKLLGHSDLTILRRYLALTDDDGRKAPSVVDSLER